MPDTFEVSRTTTINAPVEAVFAKVSNLQEWDDWSPWASMDPSMEKTYGGEQGTVGSSYHWKGNRKVGEGKMTMTEITAPSKVMIDLNFIKPFTADNVTEIAVSPGGTGDSSNVTWTMTGPMSLMTKIMGIFKSMDKMVGPDFEKGLATLKQQCEAP